MAIKVRPSLHFCFHPQCSTQWARRGAEAQATWRAAKQALLLFIWQMHFNVTLRQMLIAVIHQAAPCRSPRPELSPFLCHHWHCLSSSRKWRKCCLVVSRGRIYRARTTNSTAGCLIKGPYLCGNYLGCGSLKVVGIIKLRAIIYEARKNTM